MQSTTDLHDASHDPAHAHIKCMCMGTDHISLTYMLASHQLQQVKKLLLILSPAGGKQLSLTLAVTTTNNS